MCLHYVFGMVMVTHMYVCVCMFYFFSVDVRPTSEEKSGVDLLSFLNGYGLIHEKFMEQHIEENYDDPVSTINIIMVCVIISAHVSDNIVLFTHT